MDVVWGHGEAGLKMERTMHELTTGSKGMKEKISQMKHFFFSDKKGAKEDASQVSEQVSERFLFWQLFGTVMNPYYHKRDFEVPLFQHQALNFSQPLFWQPLLAGSVAPVISYLLRRAKKCAPENDKIRLEAKQQFYLIVWLLGIFLARGFYQPQEAELVMLGIETQLLKYYYKQRALAVASFYYRAASGGEVIAMYYLASLVTCMEVEKIETFFDFSFCRVLGLDFRKVYESKIPLNIHLAALLNRMVLFYDKNFALAILRLGHLILADHYEPSPLDFKLCKIEDISYQEARKDLLKCIAAFYRAAARKARSIGYCACEMIYLLKEGYVPCDLDFEAFFSPSLLLAKKLQDRPEDWQTEFLSLSLLNGYPRAILNFGMLIERGLSQPTRAYYLACGGVPDQFEDWLATGNCYQWAAFFYRAAITMNFGDMRGFIKIGKLIEAGHYMPCKEDLELLGRRLRTNKSLCQRLDQAAAFYKIAAREIGGIGGEEALASLAAIAVNNPHLVPLMCLVDISRLQPGATLTIFQHASLRKILFQSSQALRVWSLFSPRKVLRIISQDFAQDDYSGLSYDEFCMIINVHPHFFSYFLQTGNHLIQFLEKHPQSRGAANFLFAASQDNDVFLQEIFANVELVDYIAQDQQQLGRWYHRYRERFESILVGCLKRSLFANGVNEVQAKRLSQEGINHIGLISAHLMDWVLRLGVVSMKGEFLQFIQIRPSLFAFVYFIFYSGLTFPYEVGKILHDQSLVGLIFFFLSPFPLSEFRTEHYKNRYQQYKRCLNIRQSLVTMSLSQKKGWRLWGQSAGTIRLADGSYKAVTKEVKCLNESNEKRIKMLLTGVGLPQPGEEERVVIEKGLQEAESYLSL